MAPAYMPEQKGLWDPAFEHDACGIGFVANIGGRKSHEIIQRGLQVLVNLTHRGAAGADPETGDGAGILMQIPHRFLLEVCAPLKIRLPEPGEYGVGMVFLPRDPAERAAAEALIESTAAEEGQRVLGWRNVPVRPEHIGRTAANVQPVIRQVFLLRGAGLDQQAFERKLFVIRKRIESELVIKRNRELDFHVATLSSRTICYKGL